MRQIAMLFLLVGALCVGLTGCAMMGMGSSEVSACAGCDAAMADGGYCDSCEVGFVDGEKVSGCKGCYKGEMCANCMAKKSEK